MRNHQKKYFLLIVFIFLLGVLNLPLISHAGPNEDLLAAVNDSDTAKVKELLDKGADANSKDADDRTVLMHAAGNGSADIVKLLLEKGANINLAAANNNGKTALMDASWGGHLEVVKLLVEKGADINAKDKYNRTALKFAEELIYGNIVNFLKDSGAK